MRNAYKLLLLCAMALTALALTAGPAAAQEDPVEVESEAGGDCNPCVVHAESVQDSQIISHVFGHEEVASRCHDEFTARINHDGTGSIHHQILGPPTQGTCTQQACDGSEGHNPEWTILRSGETGPGTGHMDVNFCLEDAGGGTERECETEVQIEEGADPHHLTLHTDAHCVITFGVESEITGRWETEAVPGTEETTGDPETQVEIHHL